VDISGPNGFFYLDRLDEQNNSPLGAVLFVEWNRLAGQIDYCIESGRSEDGQTWVVDPTEFLANPPSFDVALVLQALTTSVMLTMSRQGPNVVACTVSQFDQDGRTTGRIQSLWHDRLLMRWVETSFCLGSDQVDMVRELTVTRHEAGGKVPELLDVAVLPTEKFTVTDMRGIRMKDFDPRDGIPATPAQEHPPETAVAGQTFYPPPWKEEPSSSANVEPAATTQKPRPQSRATAAVVAAVPLAGVLPLVDVVPDRIRLSFRGSTPRKAVFYLYNLTANPLTITKVDSGCGCATVSVERKLVPAHQAGRIKVQIDTAESKDIPITVRWESAGETGQSELQIQCAVIPKPGAGKE